MRNSRAFRPFGGQNANDSAHNEGVLLEFTLENFRSFRNAHTISLIANKRLKKVPGWVTSANISPNKNINLLSCTLLFGANASGKSTILDALAFLNYHVKKGVQARKPNSGTGTEPFMLDESSRKQPTRFEIVFFFKQVLFTYTISLDQVRVLRESLTVKSDTVSGRFARTYIPTTSTYRWTQNGALSNLDKTLRQRTRENVLFLSIAAEYNQEIPALAYEWLSDYLCVLDLQAERPGLHHAFTSKQCSTNASIKHRVVNLLREADLTECDLENCLVVRSDWRGADLRKAILRSAT